MKILGDNQNVIPLSRDPGEYGKILGDDKDVIVLSRDADEQVKILGDNLNGISLETQMNKWKYLAVTKMLSHSQDTLMHK